MIDNPNITRFNRFFSPEELPGQLNVARKGSVMCAAVVANPWRSGYWNFNDYMDWIEGGAE